MLEIAMPRSHNWRKGGPKTNKLTLVEN